MKHSREDIVDDYDLWIKYIPEEEIPYEEWLEHPQGYLLAYLDDWLDDGE